MANEALNQLRKELDYSAMQLVRQAVDLAVEEATARPERQFAEHQARLVKAKADKAEWDVYMATEGLRLPSFVERDPETCAPILTAPEWAKCLAMGVDVAQGDAGTRQNPYMALPESSVPVHVAAVLEAFAPEFAGMQRAVHDIAREAGYDVARAVGEAVAHAVGEAVASLSEDQEPADVQQRTEELRAAEERGFQICKQAAHSAVQRRWDRVFRNSSPSYDEGVSAALEEIGKITFPGGEG